MNKYFCILTIGIFLLCGCKQETSTAKNQEKPASTEPSTTSVSEGTKSVDRDASRLNVATHAENKKTKSEVAMSKELDAIHKIGNAQEKAGPMAPPAPMPLSEPKMYMETERMPEEAPVATKTTASTVTTVDTRTTRVEHNTEAYDNIVENSYLLTQQNPLSTFSIDVDTASYSNMRRFLTQNTLPPKDSIRIEELVNYFPYDYTPPKGDVPFAAWVEIANCPWNMEYRLARIAIKGKEIDKNKRPLSNLVFLLDVSGSMENPNKLPLLKRAFSILVQQLGENDRVAIVVYAGASGVVLPSTSCDKKEVVLAALDQLQAGGSTNAGEGIQLAYDIAVQNFIKGGTNRVILATDGDFNVGITNQGDLIRLIEEKAKSGVFLTVLGFGMYNLKDSTLEKLSDKGNGNYAYIDDFAEAKKALVEQMTGTLVTIAKDVKIQIEFNPTKVAAYRLVGYENRLLRDEDFKDDTKDAGEIGAGHTVTVFYELVPAGKKLDIPGVDPLKYQTSKQTTEAAQSNEVFTLKIRYKEPDGNTSKPLEFSISDPGTKLSKASGEFKFAAAVATFGMILRDSRYKGTASLDTVLEIADEGKGEDKSGYRAEFIGLVKKAGQLLKK